MLEEMPAGSTSEAVKTTFRGLRFSGSWRTSCHPSVTLSYIIEGIANGPVGLGVTFKLEGSQLKLPENLGWLSESICDIRAHADYGSNYY